MLKEVSRALPDENIIYLGDTARVPYGIRSPETVTRYSFECAAFLMQQKIKLLVIACNTASAISLGDIQERVSIPVIGVIGPGAKAAAIASKNRKVGIIGTEATIKSNSYHKAIKAIDNKIEVYGLACPLFVPLAEEGWTEGDIARLVAAKYLSGIKELGTDTLVLGCTHYPMLKTVIQDIMKGVCLIDSGIETAKAVSEELSVKKLERSPGGTVRRSFFVTDSPEKFVAVGELFLEQKITDIKKIALPAEG